MNKEQRERLRAGLTEAQLCRCRTYLLTTKDAIALLDALAAAEAKAWPISVDGPTPISDQRMWLARQLMDSKLTDAEAFGIVAHHPDIKDARATAAEARVAVLEGALTDTSASLAAAISLLERSPKTAAPSDRMFDQMLQDYRASLGRARAQWEIKTDD